MHLDHADESPLAMLFTQRKVESVILLEFYRRFGRAWAEKLIDKKSFKKTFQSPLADQTRPVLLLTPPDSS